MAKFILYDLPSIDNRCWSPFVWKIRLYLNYKGIEYDTKGIEYPDIAETLSEHGVPPLDTSRGGVFQYTLPAGLFPDGVCVMESLEMARRAESFPAYQSETTPQVEFDDPMSIEVMETIGAFEKAMFPGLLAGLLPLLPPPSREYFERTRSGFFGMSLQDLEKARGGDHAFAEAEQELKHFADMLNRDKSGPFLNGGKPCWGDFVLVAPWQCIRRAQPAVFQRMMAADPAFEALYTACEPWILGKED